MSCTKPEGSRWYKFRSIAHGMGREYNYLSEDTCFSRYTRSRSLQVKKEETEKRKQGNKETKDKKDKKKRRRQLETCSNVGGNCWPPNDHNVSELTLA